jgi:tetratricopeptide (TPR) repeat protein
LNDFGVSVQRSGDLDRAGKYFALAASVNPDNLAAAINRAYNVRLRSGENTEMEMTEEMGRGLQSLGGRWDRLIGENGPVDEPMSCYRLAQAFSSGNNLRQAGQQLERTLHFSPDNRSARLDYLMMCVRVRLADQALEGIANYREHFSRAGIKTEEEMELLRVEAWAKVLQNKPAEAEKILVDAQAKHPTQSLPWETLVEIHLQAGRETNALEVLKRQIEVQPRNVKALVNYGGIKLRAGDYEGALPFLDLALQQKPDDENGLFNRALASSATRRFESASKDFQALLAGGTAAYRLQASFGLAEVYFRMNRREESLRYYREFLKLAGDRTQEANVARERIKILETTKGKLPHQDG